MRLPGLVAALSAIALFGPLQWISRSDFLPLLGAYALLFLGYYLLWRWRKKWTAKHIILLAIALRVPAFFSLPNLSDDYFRFLWDGRCWWENVHPLTGTPTELEAAGLADNIDPTGELRAGMNSPEYHTVYPPVSQLFFAFAAGIGGKHLWAEVTALRGVLLLFEIGAIWLMMRLLPLVRRGPRDAVMYAFNPLVITEITGNLHFEGMVVTFLLLGVAGWFSRRPRLGIIGFGLSIAAKMTPLMLLPLWPRMFSWAGAFRLGLGLVGLLLLLFVPFLLGGLDAFGESLGLFFDNFEFNASAYYLLRWLGFQWTGFNEIERIGPLLKMLTVGLILWVSLRKPLDRRAALRAAVWCLAIYLFLATTVHPWYVVPLVGLSVLSGQRWPAVWSFLVLFSYSHYQGGGFAEQYGWIGAEYALLALAIFAESRLSDFTDVPFGFGRTAGGLFRQ